MRKRFAVVRLAVVLGLGLPLVSCGWFNQLKAMKTLQEADTLYQRQDYEASVVAYEEVLTSNPDLTRAYFYLANSYDNLYKPGRRGERENDAYLDKAVENYKIAIDREEDPRMRQLAMQYLVAAYGAEKLNDPSQSEPVLLQMIEMDPSDPGNYFVLGKLYEDAGQYEAAEEIFVQARDVQPNDTAVYLQLAGFYNRAGEFEKTIEALEARASMEPDNPEAHYTIATYYWEKAFRDFRLTDEEKLQYVMSGLEAVDRALALNADYPEALTYKNILLRLQGNMEEDLDKRAELFAEADRLRDRAVELQKRQAAGV